MKSKNARTNTRNSKILIIIALLIGVIGLSIGLAAFSGFLTIENEAYVKPDSKYFKVNFSSDATTLKTDSIEPVTSATSVTATPGNINNSNTPTITGISTTFTEPGQNVTYNFYTFNSGKYTAFLKDVSFNNIEEQSTFKRCTALPGSNITDSLLAQACEDIRVTLKVNTSTFNNTNNNITSHTLDINKSEPIELKIEYVNNNHYVDGDFKIELGNISLNYSSID